MTSARTEEDRTDDAAVTAPRTGTAADAPATERDDAGNGGSQPAGGDAPRQPSSQDDPLYRGVPDDRVGG